MKVITIVKVGLLVASLGFALTSDIKPSADNNSVFDGSISCLWITYCGDVDRFNPVSQPQDTKTETQDAKDEKLA
jgi:hypothetical protein